MTEESLRKKKPEKEKQKKNHYGNQTLVQRLDTQSPWLPNHRLAFHPLKFAIKPSFNFLTTFLTEKTTFTKTTISLLQPSVMFLSNPITFFFIIPIFSHVNCVLYTSYT